MVDDLKSPSPVVHHIPIVLEDDFYIEKRKSEHYSDKLRSLKVRRDQAGQDAEMVNRLLHGCPQVRWYSALKY